MGLMDKLRQGVVEVAEEAEKVARIGRLKTEISGFNGQKAQILCEVGQRVVAIYAKGGRTEPDFSTEWEKIQQLNAEITRREEDIEKTRAENKQPSPTERPDE